MFRTPSLVAALLSALLGLLVAFSRETARQREAGRGPDSAGNRVERCVSCHVRPDEDPGGAHAREALGCSPCHLGNPLAFGKARAHEGMEPEPGALSTAGSTCGRAGCHEREAARVATSLMARASGIVAVDRWVFGEVPSPDGDDDGDGDGENDETMEAVLAAAERTPARDHLSRLCGGCHLGARRGNRDDAIHGNGSGCSACHVARRPPGGAKRAHPPVDSRVTDDRCLGCHSRSGRISLTYQGLAEVERHQLAGGASPCAATGTLHDGRPACRLEPDVHAAAGMACVDCHLHTDLMGDGTRHAHAASQVEVRCESCHGPASPAAWGSVGDPLTRDLLRMRKETRPAGEAARLGARGTPLWNLRPAAAVAVPGQDPSRAPFTLVGKLDGRPRAVAATPRDADHTLRGHERLACDACHAAWAPTCTTCHTSFDPAGTQWDFSKAAVAPGAWRERSEGLSFAPPALGVTAGGRIVSAVPGMVMTLDARAAGGAASSHRLYAPLSPHSTGKKARTCASCHLSSFALGLGTGTLDATAKAPVFVPASPAPGDPALARDGWTSLGAPKPGQGTRAGFRSLDESELGRALAVGSFLPCHDRAADPVWRSPAAARERLLSGGAPRCRGPRS